ncbi:MAG: ABC transporter substrate-binding protein [Actinomycetota bacterium]
MTNHTTKNRARWLRLLALLAAFGMLAAACGGGTDTDEETTDATVEAEDQESFDEQAAAQQEGEDEATEEQEEVAGDGDPVRGGHLVISGPSDIGSLDPIASSSFNTQYRIAHVYQRLLGFETGPDIGYTQNVLKPELATDWEISEDNLTYTFTLRDGVTWHDVPPVNGRPFTSADVKATFEAVLAEGHQANLLERVTSIDTPDDLTVVLNLSDPFAPLLNNMASHFMWILPAEAFEEGYDRASTVIGTGPFVLTEREVDVTTRYEANPSYWDVGFDGEPLPYLDSYEQVVINDTQQVIAAFQAGEIQVMTNGTPNELRDQLMQDFPEAFYGEWIDAGMGQIGINMEREPFNDLRVRQAISLAIDRNGMGTTIRGGGTIPSNVAPAQADFALPEEEREELLQYDPERARELLAEAGFPDGLDATLIATDRYGALYTAQTEWLVEDLEAIGINVNLELLDYATYFGSRWPDVEYDIQFGPQTPFLEPDEWLRGQMGTGQGRNWYNISDPVLDDLLTEQLGIVDPDARAEKIREIQRYALTELLNPIPVWTYFTRWNYAPEFKNFFRHASYGFNGLETTWLEGGS